jgi:hypothetical protein
MEKGCGKLEVPNLSTLAVAISLSVNPADCEMLLIYFI